jgi:4-amino-4-deoxy-L-arabinose transferase-like glycosyltransferase
MDSDKKLKLWLGITIAMSLVLRVLLFATYPPVAYDDTPSYRRSAEAILDGFNDYDGTRTPGYPAFLAVLGSDKAVYAAQLCLGLLITMAWFYIGLKVTGNPKFGLIAAMAHTLNPGQLLFEANLLTETLSTFWLVLSILGAFLWFRHPKAKSVWLCFGIGLAISFAALTRPLFIFMPVWLALFMGITFQQKKIKIHWKPLVGIMLPTFVLLGGWMGWVRTHYGVFSVTTMTGYNLIQHTGYYFEDVPDEYAELRDVYLEYRQDRIDKYGTQGNTIWDAIPEMTRVSGLGFYELSQTLQSISVRLILTHPWDYLSKVVKGWWFFWRAPVYWNAGVIQSPVLLSGISLLIQAARGLIFVSNLIFIITSLGAVISKKMRHVWQITEFFWLLAGSVWATSILSSLMDHGDNPRFLIPMQTFIMFWVLWLGYQTWQALRKPNQTGEVQIGR